MAMPRSCSPTRRCAKPTWAKPREASRSPLTKPAMAPSYSAAFVPRAVAISRVFAWFEGAMRLFKRAPLRWCGLGAFTLVSKLALELVPGIGRALSEVVVPVIECGLLIGAMRIDRGAPLTLAYALAAFLAPPAALAAIVVSSLLAT